MAPELSLAIYEHAARIISRTPWEVSRDGELLYQAHLAAYDLYRHDPVVVGVDIYNLEAEAYGCEVQEPAGMGIPAVTAHPFSSVAEAMELGPIDPARDGRIAMVIEAARRIAADRPDATVCVPLSGPFSIASSLLGLNNLLMAVALEGDRLRTLLERLARGQVAMARHVARAGVGVAFFESAASPPLLSPEHFRAIELGPLKLAMDGIGAATGKAPACIIGGDTAPIVGDMLSTSTGLVICPAETDRRAFLAAAADRSEVTVRINVKHLYARGWCDEARMDVDEVIALGRSAKNRVLIGTGAIPYETGPETIFAMRDYVRRSCEV